MTTSFTTALRIAHPIVQAPIGGAASPELAAAVSNAGGLGMLALSWKSPEQTHAAIRRTQQLTDRPFGVNLVLEWDQTERVRICAEERVPLVSFFCGDPAPHLPVLRKNGIHICQTVASVAEARRAEQRCVDLIWTQGWEAGGHVRGTVSSLVLTRAVARAVRLPVVAFGGFADGSGLVAALALGAAGVGLGTRFLMSTEAAIEPEYARWVANATEVDTVYTDNLFDRGWENAPHRVLRNSTVRAWEAAGKPTPGARPNEGEALGQFGGKQIFRYSDNNPLRGTTGNLEAMALYAGQSAGLVTERLPAGEIVRQIMAEAERVAHGLPR